MKLYILILLLVSTLGCFAQNKIEHIVTERENSIEFRAKDDKVVKKINVLERNRYAKLNYPATRQATRVRYKLEANQSASVVNSFFLSKKEGASRVKATGMLATSEVIPQENFVVISDMLRLYGGGGTVGLKSIVTVFDDTGSVVATLPENNDGYFESIVTGDGKYLASLYGDIVPDAEITFVPQPGFRIYDTRTGLRIVDMPSTAKYGVLPPALYKNTVIGVLQYPDGLYEYMLFNTEQRIVYKRRFTADEVGRMSKFTDAGIWLREGTREKLIDYSKDFTTAPF